MTQLVPGGKISSPLFYPQLAQYYKLWSFSWKQTLYHKYSKNILLKYMLNIYYLYLYFYKYLLKYIKAKFVATKKESMFGVVRDSDSQTDHEEFKYQLCSFLAG